MKLVFTLVNKTTGEYETGQTAINVIYCHPTALGFTPYQTVTGTVTELDSVNAKGQYYVDITDAELALDTYDFALVQVSCNGCCDRRYKIYPDQEVNVNVDTPDVPTKEEIAEAVWDEVLSGHDTSGTAGEALASSSSGFGDIATDMSAVLNAVESLPSAGEVADSVWSEPSSTYTTAGTFGNILRINPSASAIATEVLGSSVGVNPSSGTVARYLFDIYEYTGNITTLPHDVWNHRIRSLTEAVDIDSQEIATQLDIQHIESQLDSIEGKVDAIPVDTASVGEVTDLVDGVKTYGNAHWGFDGLSNNELNAIASKVLTTDMAGLSVTTDGYTLKHLVMASQKSNVAELTTTSATWSIYDTDNTVIAERALTLNEKGAIVDTR